jgi:hypothetical protein
MSATTRFHRRHLLFLLIAMFASACSELDINAPQLPVVNSDIVMNCSADMRARTLTCKPADILGPDGIQTTRIVGGQDTYVKLASSGTGYDNGTEVFQTNVTVQNLLQAAIGSPDGTTIEGVQVFFQSGPTVTSGSGAVSILNASGVGTFTASNQPYFQYSEILEPYEISAPANWQFHADASVLTFSFQVYVAGSMVNESIPPLDAVWTGAVSTDWFTAGNWQNNAVPTGTSVVAVPLTAQNPVLTADATAAYLRVGTGSGLDLGGFVLTVAGNLDATGTMSNGRVVLTGTDVKLNGNLPAVNITGSASLQGSARTSGAVSVTGSLAVKDRALSIQIP